MDETLDSRLESWVESANDPSTDFPIQNLPFGVFRTGSGPWRVGVAIGDQILDVAACLDAGLIDFDDAVRSACRASRLNELMSLGRPAAAAVRRAVSDVLRSNGATASRARSMSSGILSPAASAELRVPADIGDYTDFYASVFHATNVGSMFRPDNPLMPNYKWVPIGYHGRSSSIVVSGTDVPRPSGQTREATDGPPTFGESRRLDYEMEVGAFIGAGNSLGATIPVERAEEHVFGFCLVNDWSARDIQSWEYQPLGPFLAKSFMTSVSPWVVTMDALEPFRTAEFQRPDGDPRPLPYLASGTAAGAFDIVLEVYIASERMRSAGAQPLLVSSGRFADMYWTVAQLVAHHASNGCNLRPGDLLASGTVSGPTPESRGCLLERTWRGKEPLVLPTGERRAFLEDGDEVIMRGWCARDGFRRIGFGSCVGRIRASAR